LKPIISSVLLLALLQASVRAQGLTDSIDIASDQSISSHQFHSDGAVDRVSVVDLVGPHNTRHLAHVLRNQRSAAMYSLRVFAGKPTTVEIEELDTRHTNVRAYLVLVDNVKTYFRTWRCCGAGPVHYFIQLPPTPNDRITITFVNQYETSFAISRLWAFSDFNSYFQSSQMDVPFHIAPTVTLTWHDRAADGLKLQQIQRSLLDCPNIKGAWTTWIAYAALDEAETNRRIDYALELANESHLPLQLCFDSWWANTPPGKWRDKKCQQRIWNESKKQFQWSTPNQWSNTPWLTMNDAELNDHKIQRLTSATKHLAAQDCHNLLSINLDNEPVYWASGNAGLGPDLLYADFNPVTITAAKSDGVTLDPTDGLDRSERQWLWHNLLTYNQLIAKAVHDNLGTALLAPDDLLRNNIYTQAMMMADPRFQYPMFDAGYPLWESAAPSEARVGGEWNAGSVFDCQQILHQLPLGRCANVNAECANNPGEVRGLRAAYALGMRYYTPYNYPIEKMDIAAAEVVDAGLPFAPFIFEPTLKEYRFDPDSHWESAVISHDNVAVHRLANTAAYAIHAANADSPGQITYKLTAPKGVFDRLALELQGRAFVHKRLDPRVRIRVLAGPTNDDSTMTQLGILHDTEDLNGLHHFDLSPVANGKPSVYVRLEFHATGLPNEVLDWCSLYALRFTIPWPAALSKNLPKQDLSLATLRKQNLVTSWRADAEQAIADLPESSRAEPQSAYDQGDYARAYHLANRATR